MEYGCIGKKLSHSFSKSIHEKLGDYRYELTELTEDRLPRFFSERRFRAVNVTIPYKQTVIPYLDELSEEARLIGAVNTIVNRDGRLCGYNTDLYGMGRLIERTGLSLQNKKVIITGSGGTSKTALSLAQTRGAGCVLRVSRSGKAGCIRYEELYALHRDADILINTTPAGMFPDLFGCPVELCRHPHLSGVIDAVYNPLKTILVCDASERGIPAAGGLFMLSAQAVKAYELFTGKRCDPETEETVFRQTEAEKKNIVLIGLPSCGKTTVGRTLAAKTGRPFFDTDEEIVKKTGKSIPELFASCGESGFRQREAEVIRELCGICGAVIATGGGAVLRKENTDRLKMNGCLYFLDRPLSLLVSTPDRPLASSPAALEELYRERIGIYTARADCRILSDGTVEDTVSAVERRHFG